jgi:hypothetical protein
MRKFKEIAVCVVGILALCMAMSDGPYFPWANLGGFTVLAVIVFVVSAEESSGWKRRRMRSRIPARPSYLR